MIGMVYDHDIKSWVAYDANLNTWRPSKAVWAFGYIVPVPNTRPPTNPWRHAYVRAKHFRRAQDSMDSAAHANGYVGLPELLAWMDAIAAEGNADWGCR